MSKPKTKGITVQLPVKYVENLKWLSSQKATDGHSHSMSDLVTQAVALYLMSLQAYSDDLKARKKLAKKLN